MQVSELSIRNHVFTWMLMAGLLIFGLMSFNEMGISQMPNVDFPVVSITLTLDGASPEVMEMDVVDPIEEGLTSIEGLKDMTSSSATGAARIKVEFDMSKDIDVAVQEIQSAIGRVQKHLPTDMDPPVIRKSNPDDTPIIFLGISSDTMSRQDLMALVKNQIQDRFSTIAGVGDIFLAGYVDPALRVWVDQSKLKKYQLTATDLINTVAAEHSEQPGGLIENAQNQFNIRTMGEAQTAKAFGNLSILERGGASNYRPIPLKDVATIEEGTEDQQSYSITNGQPAVALGMLKQPGSNAVEVADAIKAEIKILSSQVPKGVHMSVMYDSTEFIKQSVHELDSTLIYAALLTAMVCWLFLGSWTTTFNVILAIPTSIIGSFIILNALGFTLNTFTLLGLSLAIGIVVDDAIMVLENIVRHKEMGKSRFQSAIDGSKEIYTAATAATLAIIAIFLPVAFMTGVIGRYFWQFGITLSVTVALSLVEALTLTPMRCSRFLSVEPRTSWLGRSIEELFAKASRLYKRCIPVTVDHPVWTLTVALAVFFASLYSGYFLKREFVPPQDESRVMLSLQTPIGSSLEYTKNKVYEIGKILKSKPYVNTYFASIGGGSTGQVNQGRMYITFKPRDERSKSVQELMPVLRKALKKVEGVQVRLQDPSLQGFSVNRGFPIEFSIRGPDWDTLATLVPKFTEAMKKTKTMTDIDTDYEAGMPEIQVIPNRKKARERGVDIAQIASTVNAMMSGAIAGQFTEGGHRYNVRVGLPPKDRTDPAVIKSITVRNNRGEIVPLSAVVDIQKKLTLQSISRDDRQRAITFFANPAPGSSQQEALVQVQKLGDTILPAGYHVVVTGSAQTFQESFESLIFALLLGILVSYMVLASQFNSFVHPITILIALPFSVSGAFLALLATGQTLNVYSMIGMILLMGIVKKNSILLVEFTNQMKEQGLATKNALLEACPIRLRPILMTSVATIAAAIPEAMPFGPGWETRVPMAMTIIGGMIVSTTLTLFVVPSVYVLFDKIMPHRSSEESAHIAEESAPRSEKSAHA